MATPMGPEVAAPPSNPLVIGQEETACLHAIPAYDITYMEADVLCLQYWDPAGNHLESQYES